MASGRTKLSILDKQLSKGKSEVSLNFYALLFSELVQYCQNRVQTVPELQNKLSDIGQDVGTRLIDLYFMREKNGKREIKLLNMLLFVKSTLWKTLFGKEADKLEHANDDERTYYIIEKEALVNKFISVPKDKGSLNCATFSAGIIEAVLTKSGFLSRMASGRTKLSILDKQLSKGKSEVSLNFYALLFSELVQYCQNRVQTVPELQNKLSDIGQDVGTRLIDLYFMREKNGKREIKLLNMLLFVKSTLWKTLFGKEADKLEHANDDERTYYIIEKEALVNKFISVPKDKGSLNCATFSAGIIEAVLTKSGFPCKVSAHWHKGTTYMVKFEDIVISRDKMLEER